MSTPNQWEDPSADLAKMKILIIDDEPVNVALLEEILVEAGYTRFESILDSKLALQIYKTFLPAVAGDTFLLVVILTADTNEETKRRALKTPATHFLLKPFDHVEVALRTRNLLKSRRAHQLLDNQPAGLEDAVRDRTAELRATVAQLQKTN